MLFFRKFKKIYPPVISAMFSSKKSFFDLQFLSLIPKHFSLEADSRSKEPHQVPDFLYSSVTPTPLANPSIIALSPSCLLLLDLADNNTLISLHKDLSPSLSELLSGNALHPQSKPTAHNYSGYQFGEFAGQLGDGRAISIGEVMNSEGNLFELQLKGSGLTPYSRFADGRAVLRSSIREFLCSEAMFHLGIPTTRALSLVGSDDTVVRDLLYDGHPRKEKCAVVLRVSPSFIRFGSFEFGLSRRIKGKTDEKETEMMNNLVDFLFKYHYKDMVKSETESRKDLIVKLYKEIVIRTANLAALWQCFGFCHGVLNTDNMSVLGLTIDYGPFGFLDYFDEEHICNHSDKSGRYAYKNQPFICKWNLARLAEALSILAPKEEMFVALEEEYEKNYEKFYFRKMQEKVGLFHKEFKDDKDLIQDFMALLNLTKLDFTNAFRKLADFNELNESEEYIESFSKDLMDLAPPYEIFIDFYKIPITEQQLNEVKKIYEIQPRVVEMLGYTKEIIENYEKRIKISTQLQNNDPEENLIEFKEKWKKWLKKYRLRLFEEKKIENLANFTEEINEKVNNRKKYMNKVNPSFILRNYLLENCIKKAENGDFSELQNLLELLAKPFDEYAKEKNNYCIKTPGYGTKICVSCSS